MKYSAIAALCIAILSTTFFVGYTKGAEKYIKEKEQIVAKLDVATEESKQKERTWKESNDALVKKHKRDAAKLQSAIDRLLQSQNSADASTGDTCVSDGATGESGSGVWIPTERREKEVEFMSGCLRDTLRYMEMQQWAKDKNIPVEQ